jgi:hypothetical protein
MQLRPHHHEHQNAIICFLGCAPGLFLQVNQRDTEGYLHTKYPGVINIIYIFLVPHWCKIQHAW